MEKILRQGDMIFYKVEDVNEVKKVKVDKLVVGLGEVTGHSHDVLPMDGSTINVLTKKDDLKITDDDLANMDKLFFEIAGNGAVVVHEEHDVTYLEPGKYLRINQREYNPFSAELEKVKD